MVSYTYGHCSKIFNDWMNNYTSEFEIKILKEEISCLLLWKLVITISKSHSLLQFIRHIVILHNTIVFELTSKVDIPFILAMFHK